MPWPGDRKAGREGPPEVLAFLQDDTVRSLRNARWERVGMGMDADATGQALGMLGPMLDAATPEMPRHRG